MARPKIKVVSKSLSGTLNREQQLLNMLFSCIWTPNRYGIADDVTHQMVRQETLNIVSQCPWAIRYDVRCDSKLSAQHCLGLGYPQGTDILAVVTVTDDKGKTMCLYVSFFKREIVYV